MATLEELERAAEAANNLPVGTMAAVRRQETGGNQKYIDDPATYHYPLNSDGRRIAGHTGKVSTAFGPYGILESTAADPGYGVTPLKTKDLGAQVNFAASYLAARTKRAGSLEAGLAGYGEGDKYANQVLGKIKMETNTTAAPTQIDRVAQDNMRRNDVAATALEGVYQQIQGVTNAAKQIFTGMAPDAQLVRTTEQLAVAESKKQTAEAAATLGTNPNAGSYALNQLAAQSAELHTRRMAAAKEVEDIYSNPFRAFIESRVFRDASLKKLNAVADQENATNQRMKTLHDLTQEAAQTNAVIAQSVTTESAQAAGRMAAADVNMKAAQLDIDALKFNVQEISQVNSLRNDNMSIALRARDQQIQEQQVDLTRTNAALQVESLRASMEDRRDRATLKAEEIKSREDMLTAVNLGRQLNGNLPAFKSYQEMATAAKMDKNLEHMISQQYVAGITAAQTGKATLAADPYTALKYVKQSGVQLDAGRQRLINMLDSTLSELSSTQDEGVKKALAKESTASALFNERSKARAKQFAANIMSGESNIYKPPTISVLTTNTDLANTHLAANILAPLQAGGIEDLQPKIVVDRMVADIRGGKISMEQANTELGFMAEVIVGYNNGAWRYKDTAGLPQMDKVNVPLSSGGSFTNFVNRIGGPGAPGYVQPVSRAMYSIFGGDSEEIVNLRDPVSRSAYLNRQLALSIPPVLREQAAVQQKKVSK